MSRSSISLLSAPVATASSHPSGESPFVGRERELAMLAAALDSACENRGRLCLISGEPGIGKTRLADEFSARARARGARVLWGRCSETGGAPAYWPWVQILRAYMRSVDAGALSEAIGSLVGWPFVDLESTEAQFALFDAVTVFVERAAEGAPLVLVLDDVHAADEPSLRLLQFVVRGLRETRLLIMATHREGELRAAPTLARLIGALGREGTSVPLAGLNEEETGRLVEATADRSVPGSLVVGLHQVTSGNPFFLTETVRVLAAEGGLQRTALPTAPIAVPAWVREVIRRRLESLSEATREVLSAAAVMGEEFEVPVLRQVVACDGVRILAVLAEATVAGIVVAVPGARGPCRFAHALVRETLYGDLQPAHRIALHRRVGEALEVASGEARLAALAHHFFQAAQGGEGVEPAVHYSRRAAEVALAGLAYEDAAGHLERALAVLEWEPTLRDVERRDVLLALSDTRRRAGDELGARAAASEVAGIARRVNGPTDGNGAWPRTSEASNERPSATVFRRDGEYWTIAYEGREIRLQHRKGLFYLARLLQHPGREFHATELAGAADPGRAQRTVRELGAQLSVSVLGDAGALLDGRAMVEYRNRLTELREELVEAEHANDLGRAERAREELAFLTHELSAAARGQRAASAAERARLTVTKGIKASLGKIRESHPALARHLAATVKRGYVCVYAPDPRHPICWDG